MYAFIDRMEKLGYKVAIEHVADWGDEKGVFLKKDGDIIFAKYFAPMDEYHFDVNGQKSSYKEYEDFFEEYTGEKFYKDKEKCNKSLNN